MLCVCVWLQGFLVNRVLIPMINEAFYCLMEVSTEVWLGVEIRPTFPTRKTPPPNPCCAVCLSADEAHLWCCPSLPPSPNPMSPYVTLYRDIYVTLGCPALSCWSSFSSLFLGMLPVVVVCCGLSCRMLARQRTLTRACG
jgi:hypothetical protein